MKFEDWKDPNPAPLLTEHDGFKVIRDDLLIFGSKIRFIDYLIGHAPETQDVKHWVFGSCPATGGAQISLPYVCKKYGKEAHLFMAQRDMNKLHLYQKMGLQAGGNYHWVPNGMLNVTQARAREYYEEDPTTRRLFPIGLNHPTVIASIIKVARTLPEPDAFWSVGSSGTLNRGLQEAWPNAEAHVVSVGHSMKPEEIGRAKLHLPSYGAGKIYKFDQPVKGDDIPPFPSAPTYDAKCWGVMKRYYHAMGYEKPKNVYMWNVLG